MPTISVEHLGRPRGRRRPRHVEGPASTRWASVRGDRRRAKPRARPSGSFSRSQRETWTTSRLVRRQRGEPDSSARRSTRPGVPSRRVNAGCRVGVAGLDARRRAGSRDVVGASSSWFFGRERVDRRRDDAHARSGRGRPRRRPRARTRRRPRRSTCGRRNSHAACASSFGVVDADVAAPDDVRAATRERGRSARRSADRGAARRRPARRARRAPRRCGRDASRRDARSSAPRARRRRATRAACCGCAS